MASFLENAQSPKGAARRPLPLGTPDYMTLAAFRHMLRRYLRFSESAAAVAGLTAQHYQAMLIVRASAESKRVTINDLAQQLLIKHNSAVGLVDRLVAQGLAVRRASPEDRRKVNLRLSARGNRLLERLAGVHRRELQRFGPEVSELLRRIVLVAEEREERG